MGDIWAFLMQTLTVSGAAALVLLLKGMFTGRLSPRWQCAAWLILLPPLVLPTGRFGRHVLVNWPIVVETLRSMATGRFDQLTAVYAPVPLPPLAPPRDWADWLFFLYFIVALALPGRDVTAYVRLRRALRRGTAASAEVQGRIDAVAARYGLGTCPAVTAPGLPTAFVCGVFRPLLVLPEGAEVDDKVLLHELLHLKYRDAGWGLLIAFFRCVHWCNPLLWVCANRAGNDIESLCDQRVLERLEGEERRTYGRILLSMADGGGGGRPGTSSMANGPRNIRRRIEAIARFKRYPAGMGVAAVCVALMIAAPVAFGTVTDDFWDLTDTQSTDWQVAAAMSAARTAACTTPAGAVDAYGKAVIVGSPMYRAMCAPLSEQDALAEALRTQRMNRLWERWDSTLPTLAAPNRGYVVYNLTGRPERGYEGLLVIQLAHAPKGAPEPPENTAYCYLGVQTIRVERQGGRWVVLPQEDFRTVLAKGWDRLPSLNCTELPCQLYEAKSGDFTLRLRWQTTCTVDSYTWDNARLTALVAQRYDTTPLPGAEFTYECGQQLGAIYTGSEEGRGNYRTIGAELTRLRTDDGGSAPLEGAFEMSGVTDAYGGGTDGSSWGTTSLVGDWGSEIYLSGGGGLSVKDDFSLPEGFRASFFLNGRQAAELTLLPVKGGGAFE